LQTLQLPSMVQNNQDPKNTAFAVSVDATKAHGISTGISAADRATTVRWLANSQATAADFSRPGHLFPLKARPGGVLTRDGHTEATVDLARLAGRAPVGVLCEIVSEDHPTEMMRLPEMKRFAQDRGYVLTSIADLIQYRKETGQ
jgi:3,4-dihydroxy 2-butanone 4-phosphate synthase / GTP cyclohydrolase II